MAIMRRCFLRYLNGFHLCMHIPNEALRYRSAGYLTSSLLLAAAGCGCKRKRSQIIRALTEPCSPSGTMRRAFLHQAHGL